MPDISDTQQKIQQALNQKEEAERNMNYYREQRDNAQQELQSAYQELEQLKAEIDNTEYDLQNQI